jgi:hypothetical protein
VKSFRMTLSLVLVCVVSACSDSKSPTAPATPPVPATLTKPAADSPADSAQLDNVRPTLTVVNSTSNQSGTKTYEFQISDNSAFTASENAVSSPEVSEDPSGKTNNASFVQFDGTYAGMTLKNLWVGSTPRPTSLGSAIARLR